MPTIREYKNKPGYYIYARPSDVGNVTYGIDEVAYPIFKKLGYTHGDPISWRIIRVLKILDLDDTDEGGVTPDVEPEKFEELIETDDLEHQQFFELLKQFTSISAEEEQDVLEALGLTTIKSNHKEHRMSFEERLNTRMNELLSEMETQHLLSGGEHDGRAIHVMAIGDQSDIDADLLFTLEDNYQTVPDGVFVEYYVTLNHRGYTVEIDPRRFLKFEERAEVFQHVSVFDELFYDMSLFPESKNPTVKIRF